jgi:hypothetical protein
MAPGPGISNEAGASGPGVGPGGEPGGGPAANRRGLIAWCFHDWANSAFPPWS